jgi:serine/threonine-protein kinase 11
VKRRKKVNNYLFQRKIGKGSSAKVFLAVDVRNGQRYAIKEISLKDLTRSTVGITQLEREIRLMGSLSHPNIMTLREVLCAEEPQMVYLVLDYAENGSLADYIDMRIQIPRDAIFSIMKQIINALIYVHSEGYVHQDIKPGNILMTKSGKAVLGDFGIGHSFESAWMVVGSPAFQAPEALADDRGPDIDPQAEDVWAIGITFFQLLYGSLPWRGNNLYEIISDIQSRPLDFPPEDDPEVITLVKGMLTVNPLTRMKLEQVRDHPYISSAADLALTLPMAREDNEGMVYDGRVVSITAKVCDQDYSFSRLNLGKLMVPSPSLKLCANAPGSLGRTPKRSNSCMLQDADD